ncbi:hypothetical protein HQ42_00405 [Porphyromonas gulae]|uniref:sulfatase-like hydrolase/transferase n=1 Tax=Porphyromonas gulae TaxID=111105 RepID=UPI00052CAE33|nr:sulfatase-like hydrolase/transferase [Porphyromonas gulae]KGO03542.1 hypothetical protein HQ42_00405 [Porphyromonas gulae]
MERKQMGAFFLGLDRRLYQLIWLLIFLFLVQFFNLLELQAMGVDSQGQMRMLRALLAWSLVGYLVPAFIPNRIIRNIVIGIELVYICVSFLTDFYLINIYRLPFSGAMAQPILATNPSEAIGFFRSGGNAMLFGRGLLLLLVAFVIARLLPWSVRKGFSLLFILMGKMPTSVRGFHPGRWGLIVLVLLMIFLGVWHAKYIYAAYRSNWIRYNAMSLPERLWLSNRMAQKEISLSNIYYHPQAPHENHLHRERTIDTPHNVIVVYDRLIYPHLMHCYGHYIKNTPTIDSLIASQELFILDKAYTADNTPHFAMAQALSYYDPGDESSWDVYPTLPGVMRLAGYRTFWLDNTPKATPWLDVVPQLAADCDSSYHVNLRASEECWNGNSPLDEAVLEHLTDYRQGSQSVFSVIHLQGGEGSIWSRVNRDFWTFDRRHFTVFDNIQPDDRDVLAQYHNLLLYHDHILGKIIDFYSSTPSIVIYMGNLGVQGDTHPYDGTPIDEADRSRVPFMIYLSPEMKRLRPDWSEQIQALIGKTYSTADFPEWLTRLLGFEYFKNKSIVVQEE